MVVAYPLPQWLSISLPQSIPGPWCVTHLAFMPSEPLTVVVVSSASSSSLCTLKGWRLLYTSSFEIGNTLYLVVQASWGKVPWCGHWCALPISLSHKWVCGCGRLMLLSTYSWVFMIFPLCDKIPSFLCFPSGSASVHVAVVATWVCMCVFCVMHFSCCGWCYLRGFCCTCIYPASPNYV